MIHERRFPAPWSIENVIGLLPAAYVPRQLQRAWLVVPQSILKP
jgi:hypothetical protein